MTLDALGEGAHPCLMLPTGAGKSVVLAELCRRLVTEGKRVLMATHVKELIEQNAARLRGHWPGAPLGVYSAGLGRKELGRPITYAGIQSIAQNLHGLRSAGAPDVIIVDEAHLIPKSGEGRYRKLFEAFPGATRIGLTATPWRLGSGSIADGDGALFDRLVVPPGSTVRELVDAGHLAPLRSKHTDLQLQALLGGVSRRGGDYVESELAAAVNVAGPNEAVAREIIKRGELRRHWLLFCVSVDHAHEMARILTELGHAGGVVTGEMGALERTDALTRFRIGEWRWLANVNVLTTGYDFPDLDLLAFIRPTLSPTLYVQMGGRGMRLKSHAADCMVLDFAGLVAKHGPITDVSPPKEKGKGGGECPVKNCPECSEIVHASVMVCPGCGYVWPKLEKPKKLHNDDIMGEVGVGHVASWKWMTRQSSVNGRPMLVVEYELAHAAHVEQPDGTRRSVRRVTENLTLWHPEPACKFAKEKLDRICSSCGVQMVPSSAPMIAALNAAQPPATLKLKSDGKWVRVTRKNWGDRAA